MTKLEALRKTRFIWHRFVLKAQAKELSAFKETICPCCTYSKIFNIPECTRCPIYEFTSTVDCHNTPYFDYDEAWSERDFEAMEKYAKEAVDLLDKIIDANK